MDRQSLTIFAVLVVSITSNLIPITAQRSVAFSSDEKQQPVSDQNKNSDKPKAQSQPPTPVVAIAPTASGGEKAGAPPDENIAIQRDIAASTRKLAQDTQRYADYTCLLVVVAAIIGVLQIGLLFFQSLYTGKAVKAAEAQANQARRAANTAKKSLLLTQRADLLLEGVNVPGPLTRGTQITLLFKNFGPTRADNVNIERMRLFVPGIADIVAPPMPRTVVGAGDITRPHFPTLGAQFDDATIVKIATGTVPMRFEVRLSYTDVFGKPHECRYTGTYDGATGPAFLIDDHNAAD